MDGIFGHVEFFVPLIPCNRFNTPFSVAYSSKFFFYQGSTSLAR